MSMNTNVNGVIPVKQAAAVQKKRFQKHNLEQKWPGIKEYIFKYLIYINIKKDRNIIVG